MDNINSAPMAVIESEISVTNISKYGRMKKEKRKRKERKEIQLAAIFQGSELK